MPNAKMRKYNRKPYKGYRKNRLLGKSSNSKARSNNWQTGAIQRGQFRSANVWSKGTTEYIPFKYVTNLTMSTGVSPTPLLFGGQYSYRLTNLNLPFVGQAVNFQLPQGYTQAAVAYTYFKVYAVKIRAIFHDPDDDCQVGMLITSSNDTFDLQADTVTLAGQKIRCVVRPLAFTGKRRVEFNVFQRIGNIEGLDKSQYNGDMSFYSYTFNNSVASALTDAAGTTGDLVKKKEPRVHIAIASNTTTAATCSCKLEITYYTKVWGKSTLPQSTSAA